MIELNKIYNEDCLEGMKGIEDDFVDLTITSPPYDNLRTYNGYTFDFKNIARELYRVTKVGGVLVWVVSDATIKGSETLSSLRQTIHFNDVGFNVHDTMIYKKTNYLPSTHNRYAQEWEYMFVFSKGKPKTFNPIKIPCKYAGHKNWGQSANYTVDGKKRVKKKDVIGETKIKGNIFEYRIGNSQFGEKSHPAVFPEDLVHDQIVSWSNEGDIVFDPFMGSGTTAKVAILKSRNFIGFEVSEEYCDLANKRIKEVINIHDRNKQNKK